MKSIDRIIEEARADMMPFNTWEMLPCEKTDAYAAFCVYRDFGADRNIKKAIDSVGKNEDGSSKYSVWRVWAVKYRWKERAADYDKYIDSLKQAEVRKNIEAQGEIHRQVAGKMLNVVSKKLDLMNPEDLTQGNVPEWLNTAVKVQREVDGLVAPNGKTESNKQGEFNFVSDFQGL